MARWLVTTSAWEHFIFPFLKEQTEKEKAWNCTMLWLKPCIVRNWEFATRQTRHPWIPLLLSPFPVISSCTSVAPWVRRNSWGGTDEALPMYHAPHTSSPSDPLLLPFLFVLWHITITILFCAILFLSIILILFSTILLSPEIFFT